MESCRAQGNDVGEIQAFDDRRRPDESFRAYAYGDELPTQAEAVTQGTQTVQTEYKSTPDLDYLQVYILPYLFLILRICS